MVGDPRELLGGERRAPAHDLSPHRPLAPHPVGAGQRVEITLDGVVAVDQRLTPADRAPEVVHVSAEDAAHPAVELQHLRLIRDQHGHRAAALRGLAGGLQAIARDIRADDERRTPPALPEAIQSEAAITAAVPP